MKHEEFQKKRLSQLRRVAKVPEDASLVETVKALAAQGDYAEATELLFGTERTGEFANLDRFGWGFYMQLYIGNYPELIGEIADNHRWGTNVPRKGLGIQVYPDEWFVIPEPLATQTLKAMLG